jgi:hypothetical protein
MADPFHRPAPQKAGAKDVPVLLIITLEFGPGMGIWAVIEVTFGGDWSHAGGAEQFRTGN